jgi:crotonobetainyl-CoA:carnitine CoA-transferase CaiB-like acyl-CoA transferase
MTAGPPAGVRVVELGGIEPVPFADTDELLREIGVDAAKLRQEGVVA